MQITKEWNPAFLPNHIQTYEQLTSNHSRNKALCKMPDLIVIVPVLIKNPLLPIEQRYTGIRIMSSHKQNDKMDENKNIGHIRKAKSLESSHQ
jgi:hypothetical protein